MIWNQHLLYQIIDVWYHIRKLYLINNEKNDKIKLNHFFYKRRPINLLFCQDCYRKWHFVENWKTGDATRSCLLKYRHLFYRTFQPLLPPFNTCTVVETKVIFKIVIITITTIYLKTIDIRAISEKRNRLRLAWFDMIIIEQCYLFRRGFTKEIAKIRLIQRDLKQADVISFRMEGRTQKQG